MAFRHQDPVALEGRCHLAEEEPRLPAEVATSAPKLLIHSPPNWKPCSRLPLLQPPPPHPGGPPRPNAPQESQRSPDTRAAYLEARHLSFLPGPEESSSPALGDHDCDGTCCSVTQHVFANHLLCTRPWAWQRGPAQKEVPALTELPSPRTAANRMGCET